MRGLGAVAARAVRSAAAWLALAGLLAAPVAGALEVRGTVEWGREAVLGALVSGLVEEVAVERGQRVASGDLLVRLDPRPFDLDIEAARAAVGGIAPRLQEARREAERARALYDRAVLSDHELQLAQIALAEAQAAHRAARARLERARLAREYSELRAPAPGLVLEVLVAPGEAVVAADRAVPMVRIAPLDALRARASLPAEAARRLAPGAPVQVELEGRRWPGQVTGVLPREGAAELWVRFSPEDPGLHFPGMPVTIRAEEEVSP